ncbi:MAG: hypothetical protein CMJ18_04680 [Phycisphaeraceae bacterium]|nr:hypothetical protein [Phycisphaeraceae bacterium]
MTGRPGASVGLIALATICSTARPDAIVVSQAMSATTVCEIFIEQDVVRVEFWLRSGCCFPPCDGASP